MLGYMQTGYTVNFFAMHSEQLKPCCTHAIFAETRASNQPSTRPEVIFLAVVSQENPSAHPHSRSLLPLRSVPLQDEPMYLVN